MRQALTARRRRPRAGSSVYADAPHGFHADYRDSYTPAAATDAWGKAVAFFDGKLKVSPSPASSSGRAEDQAVLVADESWAPPLSSG